MHTRGRKIVEIPFEDIEFHREIAIDQRYLQLIRQQYEGKLKVALTRLPSDQIISGFFKRERGQNIHVPSEQPALVDLMRGEIRRGGRPAVELYWSNLAPNGGGYVCPDGEWLPIYADLGITQIPVRILRPVKRPSSEGAVWIEADDTGTALAQVVGPKTGDYAAYRDASIQGPTDALKTLVDKCIAAQSSITAFHCSGGEVHYHEMLHAVLRRHGRSLNSMGILIQANRLEHASLIGRAAYEAFLNFYLDWLAPEFFGPRMQLLSLIRTRCQGSETDLDALRNFRAFLENTLEKARASVLGEGFYRALYPGLSRMVHQSYAYVEREADSFIDTADELDSVERLVLCMNVVTHALIERILNDVGVAS